MVIFIAIVGIACELNHEKNSGLVMETVIGIIPKATVENRVLIMSFNAFKSDLFSMARCNVVFFTFP